MMALRFLLVFEETRWQAGQMTRDAWLLRLSRLPGKAKDVDQAIFHPGYRDGMSLP